MLAAQSICGAYASRGVPRVVPQNDSETVASHVFVEHC